MHNSYLIEIIFFKSYVPILLHRYFVLYGIDVYSYNFAFPACNASAKPALCGLT